MIVCGIFASPWAQVYTVPDAVRPWFLLDMSMESAPIRIMRYLGAVKQSQTSGTGAGISASRVNRASSPPTVFREIL